MALSARELRETLSEPVPSLSAALRSVYPNLQLVRQGSRNDRNLSFNTFQALGDHHLGELEARYDVVGRMNLEPGDVVLDVGCGGGEWLPLFADYLLVPGLEPEAQPSRIIATDFSPAAVSRTNHLIDTWRGGQLRAIARAELSRPGGDLPLDKGTATKIFCNHVSQYLDDPVGVYREFADYLVPAVGEANVIEMDFGSMRVGLLGPWDAKRDAELQALWQRVVFARWVNETARLTGRYRRRAFENTWVGPDNHLFMTKAGYTAVRSETIGIHLGATRDEAAHMQFRPGRLTPEQKRYILNMAHCMVLHNPFVTRHDRRLWKRYCNWSGQ